MKTEIIEKIKSELDDQKLDYLYSNVKKIYENNYKLSYGYTWFNNAKLNKLHTDLYNKNSIDIIFYEINKSNKDFVELLKNENHRLIVSHNPLFL